MSTLIHRRTRTIALIAIAVLGSSFLAVRAATDTGRQVTNDKRIVDCLVQGQIRKLGSTIYQAPPRPLKLPARDCEIRGGDFLVFDRASYSASLGHWLALAKEGDVNAQIYVGEIFERGMGREPDYAQAAAWYKRAADAGHPVAQISLAQLYERGLGVRQDPAEAERLYRQAFGPAVEDSVALDSRSLEDPAERMLRLEQRLDRAREDADALKAQLAAAEQSLASAESNLEARQSEEVALAASLDQARKQVQAADADSVELRTARAELERRNREFEAQQFTIAQLKEQIARGQTQIVAYQGEFDRVSELEAELREQSRKYEEANAELRGTRAALAESNRQLSEQQQRFEAERQALLEARKDLTSGSQVSEQARLELETQVIARESRLAEQAESLESMRAEIDVYQKQSVDLQNRLTELRRENEELIEARSDATRYRDESERLRVALAETQNQLVAMEAQAEQGDEVAQLESELARVREEAGRYRTRLNELGSAQQSVADLAAPEIQLIEPLAFNTRSNASISVTALEEMAIVGKVSAPAGLLTLMVNQQPTPVNANYVFQSTIALKGEETPVRITAIDSQGKRTEQVFSLVNKALKQIEAKARLPNVSFGKFHALLIGNENYSQLPDLVTPIEDIEAIDTILRQRYGFTTTVVRDGTRESTMDSMYKLLGELTSEDNLLIYYAGHGEYVTDTNRGVWLPVDANPSSPANWITNVEISDYLKQIAAKQIVVIADSCYSGALTRSALINLRPGLTDEEYEAHLKRMASVRARVVLTSGGLAPVLDSANPGSPHSIFAAALIEILNKNTTVLSAQDLGRTIAAKVSLAASRVGYEQEPQYAPLNHANHQGGDFFFVPQET
jgi:hypothetical protein